MIDKDVCDKGFTWNPSNCECECNKSCDVEEYLDFSNCKCRKKLVGKLVEDCTKNIDQVEITEITLYKNKNKHKCSSCTLYVVLFSIVFRSNVVISTYFVYSHWYLKNYDARAMLDARTVTTIY